MQQLEKKDFSICQQLRTVSLQLRLLFPVQNYAEFKKCMSTTSREIDTYECRYGFLNKEYKLSYADEHISPKNISSLDTKQDWVMGHLEKGVIENMSFCYFFFWFL